MGVTSDRNDPRLTHGADDPAKGPVPQAEVYLVLSDEELAKGFVRPLRSAYWHTKCRGITTMGYALSATYARDPKHYGATYCVICQLHRPVGENGEFHWVIDIDNLSESDPKVGT